MRLNKRTYHQRIWGTGLLFLMFVMPIFAQDPLPSSSAPQAPLSFPEENLSEKYPLRIIPVDDSILSDYRGTKENKIDDP